MTAPSAPTPPDGGRVAVMLTQAEIGWALSALVDALITTKRFLTPTPSQHHDPCCPAEAHRQAHREEIHQGFLQQKREIESAIAALEAVEVRDDDEEPSR